MREEMGRGVLVTGGARGIGFGIAVAFLACGDSVAINCREDEEGMRKALRELGAMCGDGQRAIGCRADVSKYSECGRLVAFAEEGLGRIDVLVNCAGKEYVGLYQDMAEDAIVETINGNLMPVLLMSRLVLPSMLTSGSGSIVNISSIWGVSGASCEVAYSAAKAGIIGFTKALAKELGPAGIRVNAIACGAFDTRMNEHLGVKEKEIFSAKIPLGRFGQASEAGPLAVFLASDEAGYLTGQAVNLDGGFL